MLVIVSSKWVPTAKTNLERRAICAIRDDRFLLHNRYSFLKSKVWKKGYFPGPEVHKVCSEPLFDAMVCFCVPLVIVVLAKTHAKKGMGKVES